MVEDKSPKIPTAQEKVLAEFENINRMYVAMRENAEIIATTRRALYLEYLKAGFDKSEAMNLVKGSLLL